MRFFRSKTKTDEEQQQTNFVGAQCPYGIVSYLALYGMIEGISKSYLIREALARQVRLLEKDLPLIRLKEKAIVQIRAGWKEKDSSSIIEYNNFKTFVMKEMEGKGVSKEVIEQIFSEL